MSPFPIRRKMTLAALAPLVLTLLAVSFGAFYLINAWVVGQAQDKVRNDLNAAREVYRHETSRVDEVVRFTAHTAAMVSALDAPLDTAALESLGAELNAIRQRERLDILTLTDAWGRVIVRSASPLPTAEEKAPALPFVKTALSGTDFAGTVLLSQSQLRQESPDLPERARIALRPPLPPNRPVVESRGLVLLAATPVHDKDNRILGSLYGGILLNGNLSLVDRIRDIVYGDDRFEGTEIGSATIFLEDLRIATTIRLRSGERALGTRVSAEVASAVLQHQESWLARAKVVDDWYLTAYEPILDPQGLAIGALYVGLLEKPFGALKQKAGLILLALLGVGSGLGFVLSHILSERLSSPIRKLADSAEQLAAGRSSEPLAVTNQDEIGHLTTTFNRMTEALRDRDEALRELNRDLEQKVTERTVQLQEKSLELIRTQEELLRSEKLAAIGSLAAGVAHEINNPAAIIRGNVEILMMTLPPGSAGREEAEEILKQTDRVSLITRNMLTFASEQTIHPEMLQVNELLEEILAHLRHQIPLQGVVLHKEMDPHLPPLAGDPQRLRQVFTNIVVNAVQAMDGQGRLEIATRRSEGVVEITIADSGPGMAPQVREKIFNPFFTTKKRGSGLGLSVSYGIIKSLGGTIGVESDEGQGALFRIRLPLAHTPSWDGKNRS